MDKQQIIRDAILNIPLQKLNKIATLLRISKYYMKKKIGKVRKNKEHLIYDICKEIGRQWEFYNCSERINKIRNILDIEEKE